MLRFGLALPLLLCAASLAHAQASPKGQLGKEWQDKRGYVHLAQIGINIAEPETMNPAFFREVAFDWRKSNLNVGPYPPEAYAKSQGGVVTVALDTLATGGVKSCRMIKSSGVPSLDAHACPQLLARGWFVPPMDRSGVNQPSSFTAQIDYSLMLGMVTAASGPSDYVEPPRPQPVRPIDYSTLALPKGTARPSNLRYISYSLAVDPMGTPTACQVRETTGTNAFDTLVCNALIANAKFKPAVGKTGAAVNSVHMGGFYVE